MIAIGTNSTNSGWTEQGLPPRIDRDYFRDKYGQNFPDLLPADKNHQLDGYINDVYVMFFGCQEIFNNPSTDRETYINKTQLLFGLLVAWYIADMRPDLAIGVISSGGIPIKRKRIGDIDITFADIISGTSNGIEFLKSNAFGVKAYNMVHRCLKVQKVISVGGRQ